MYRLTDFNMAEMTRCSRRLRNLKKDGKSFDSVANEIVRHLYEEFAGENGERAFALVRLFVTIPSTQAPEHLAKFARKFVDHEAELKDVPCLTLVATRGSREAWNHRSQSAGHQCIPLPSEQFVRDIPMIASLLSQFGTRLVPSEEDAQILLDVELDAYNVFFLPQARGSHMIPHQADFVIPEGIRSVIGFGGSLPPRGLFVVILFSRAAISREVANMFRPLALSAKAALLPYRDSLFAVGNP